MKTLYLECNMGASGDMLMGALVDLLPDPTPFVEKLNRLGIPGVTVECERAASCGINGIHMAVRVHGLEEDEHIHAHEHNHEHAHDHDHEHEHEHVHAHEHEHEHKHSHHHHTGMAEIRSIVAKMPVSTDVKLNVLAVYNEIAAAESAVHGTTVDQIHFHEVGSMDAVADITGVCLLMEELDVDQVVCSTVHTGFGQVQCAHGVLPVPAPATAKLLTGIPCAPGKYEGELCTPTGAALLRHFVDRFTGMPEGMIPEKIGVGLGTRQFPAANILRAWLGEVPSAKTVAPDQVWELRCNLDDCTGEDISYACDLLLEAGALDVFTTPIQMKKGRPGVLLTCLCQPRDEEKLTRLMLTHTSTLGVRRTLCQRTTLSRRTETVNTEYGPIRVKVSEGSEICRPKPEFDDLAAAARAAGMPLEAVRSAVLKAL